MNKPKPCPFCGCDKILVLPHLADKSIEIMIWCAKCKATMFEFDSEDDAVEMWNRRVK